MGLASRQQQRITAIMRYAVQNGLIACSPTQGLKDALATRKSTHRSALPLKDYPIFLLVLNTIKDVT
ncbi:hypothetical protein [Photorhabdus laumondii]|uniref:hypothetical protein n=1 Tax=Photorhabdus laumondii TaxID=2218628 RepID=UPI00374494FC